MGKGRSWAMLQNQSFGAVPAGDLGWEGQGLNPWCSAAAVWLPQHQPPVISQQLRTLPSCPTC